MCMFKGLLSLSFKFTPVSLIRSFKCSFSILLIPLEHPPNSVSQAVDPRNGHKLPTLTKTQRQRFLWYLLVF